MRFWRFPMVLSFAFSDDFPPFASREYRPNAEFAPPWDSLILLGEKFEVLMQEANSSSVLIYPVLGYLKSVNANQKNRQSQKSDEQHWCCNLDQISASTSKLTADHWAILLINASSKCNFKLWVPRIVTLIHYSRPSAVLQRWYSYSRFLSSPNAGIYDQMSQFIW